MTSGALAKKMGLLLDTNLLVLYVVGYYDPKRISPYRRTNKYTVEDFDLLRNFMARFRQFATTPNILTETSNLLEGDSYQYGPIVSIMPELIQNFIELYEPSHPILTIHNKAFIKFGLSDAVSCKVVEQNYLILTDDLPLCYYLQNNGFDALNFNHLRSGYLLS